MNYCVVILCCLDCKHLESINFTNDYKNFLFNYYCDFSDEIIDLFDSDDYVFVYETINGNCVYQGLTCDLPL